MKTSTIKIKILSIISLIGLYFLFYKVINNELLFPHINLVLTTLLDILISISFFMIFFFTILRFILCFVISFIFGLVLGLISALWNSFYLFLRPYMNIFKSLPFVCLVMIVFIFLGYRITPYVITILVLLPLIFQATYDGIKNIDEELIAVYQLDSPINLKIIFNVYLPLIISYIKVAVMQMIGLGIKVLISSEFLCQTPLSFGKEIASAINNIEYNKVFAYSIIIIIMVNFFENCVNFCKNLK